MENKFLTLLKNKSAHGEPVPCQTDHRWLVPYEDKLLREQHEEIVVLIPDPLPLFINPKAKISRDGRILNLHEFKTLDDVFDFSRCLQCHALLQEHYFSSVEPPCMGCHVLVKKIKEKNILRHHVLSEFQSSSFLH